MPRIFDNIDRKLLPMLQETLCVSNRADFSVGYFNLRGWKSLAPYVDEWLGGDGLTNVRTLTGSTPVRLLLASA